MSVGIIVPLPAYTLHQACIATKAEAVGFESLWYHEHPILPVESASPCPATGGEIPWTYRHFSEPYMALAMAAAVTSTIKLATGITLMTERNPLLLAKEIAVLDLHSHGRFLFGVGAGWNPEETTILGGDFDHRWSQAREAVLALKALWTQEAAAFHGRYDDSPRSIAIPNRRRNPIHRSCWGAMPPMCSSGWHGMPTAGCRTALLRARSKKAGSVWTPWRPRRAGIRPR